MYFLLLSVAQSTQLHKTYFDDEVNQTQNIADENVGQNKDTVIPQNNWACTLYGPLTTGKQTTKSQRSHFGIF